MKHDVTIFVPIFGEKDEYGRPAKEQVSSKARVQYSTRTVKGTNGQSYETSLEVDLPPDAPVGYGIEIEYKDWAGKVTKGQVVAMNESTNLAGNKVFFRTVYVG